MNNFFKIFFTYCQLYTPVRPEAWSYKWREVYMTLAYLSTFDVFNTKQFKMAYRKLLEACLPLIANIFYCYQNIVCLFLKGKTPHKTLNEMPTTDEMKTCAQSTACQEKCQGSKTDEEKDAKNVLDNSGTST